MQIQNTSLTATLAALPAGNNATFDQQLQFTVMANATNIARIELFSTGGSVDVITNQATAVFDISASFSGTGIASLLRAGHRPNRESLSNAGDLLSHFSTITLTLTGTPPTLAWTAISGRQYDVLFTTNLAVPFETLTTISATILSFSGQSARPEARGFIGCNWIRKLDHFLRADSGS